MKYLLDVNALVALGFLQHEFHGRVSNWVRKLSQKGVPELATCSITELGFVRVLVQAPQYGFNVAHARDLLLQLKSGTVLKFAFVIDDQDVSHLPAWVKSARQTTDGHLAQLARANGAVLATLDSGIPGTYLIPASNGKSRN
jgi:predicted nucleic acid-binding protein